MSEPVTRQRPSIDLDAFERHLDDPHAGHHDDDPLAELARLVGDPRDPYENVFAQEALARPARDHAVHEFSAHGFAGHHVAAPREPQFDRAASASPLAVNFAAIEAGLRGSLPAHGEPSFAPQDYEQPVSGAHAGHAQAADEDYAFDPHYAEGYGREAPARASRRPVYLVAATIAIGVIGVGAAFALKGHSTNPADVRTIAAAEGPTKIQPPAQENTDSSGQDSALLGKGNQPQPTKVVSNTEEPVDVGATVQNNAAQAAPGMTDAASVPVPPAPGQTDASNGASPAPATDFAMGMPAPKKVKVVSVRPDGTILSDTSVPSAPATDAAPSASVDASAGAPAPVAEAATPKPATPKASTPKSASRVTPRHAARADAESAAANDGAAPDAIPADAAPTKSAKKAKAQKLAMAEPTDTAPAADEAPKSGGGFAVQLAAPGSEAEARAVSAKLAHKFSGALDGHRLGFHKAQSNGRTVYRVRTDGLSKEAAQSLCEKLKASGGSCFVAKS